MKILKKYNSYFNNVWSLLVLLLLNFGCTESPEDLTDFLYELAEIDVENRAGYLDEWLKMQDEFPLINGNDVYFIFKEKREVPIFLKGDMNRGNSEKLPLMKIIGTDYYYIKQTYPLESAFEYMFIVNSRHYLDPLNKKIIKGKKELRSLLFMPEYKYPVETLTRINKGYTKLDTINYKEDILYFYRHSNVSQESPIIVFLNGKDYLQLAEANIILDNLIDDGKIIPCYAAFLQNNADATNLLPFLKKEFNLTSEHAIIGGNENAGLLIFKNPQIFQKFNSIFVQSAFCNTDSLVFLSELNGIDFSEKNIFMSYGHFEKQDSIYDKVINFYESKTAYINYEKYNEGPSWLSWKGHLDNALIYFLKQEKQPGL